jgi:uncharacterized membrane protein
MRVLFFVFLAILILVVVQVVKMIVDLRRGKKSTQGKHSVLEIASIILLIVSGFFLTFGLVLQLVPMRPENVHYTVNGVAQVATEKTVQTIRMMFLLIFGGFGALFAVISLVIRRALTKRLRQ